MTRPGSVRRSRAGRQKRLKRLGTAAEINQQNVLARNRSLDAENQHDPAIARVGLPPADVELPLVQRDGQHLVAEGRGALDETFRRVRNPVDRIAVMWMCSSAGGRRGALRGSSRQKSFEKPERNPEVLAGKRQG